jgi:hypothetical protein
LIRVLGAEFPSGFDNVAIILAVDNSKMGQVIAAQLRAALHITHIIFSSDARESSRDKDQNDMTELFVLAKVETLIQDNTWRDSSFLAAAWWLGGAHARLIKVAGHASEFPESCSAA